MVQRRNDEIENSVNVQSFLKANISVPESEKKIVETKNHRRKREKENRKRLEEIKEQPIKLRWFFLSAIVVAFIIVTISNYTSKPSELEYVPNHVQKAQQRMLREQRMQEHLRRYR